MAMCPGNFCMLSALGLSKRCGLMQHVHWLFSKMSDKVWLVSMLLGLQKLVNLVYVDMLNSVGA